jgi:hypothetical protein
VNFFALSIGTTFSCGFTIPSMSVASFSKAWRFSSRCFSAEAQDTPELCLVVSGLLKSRRNLFNHQGGCSSDIARRTQDWRWVKTLDCDGPGAQVDFERPHHLVARNGWLVRDVLQRAG